MLGSVRKQELRGQLFATLAATGAAWTWSILCLLPEWLSPSSGPVGFGILGIGAGLFLLTSLLVNAWLLPACLVLDWVIARRGVVQAGPMMGFTLSAIAVTSVPFLAAMPGQRLFGDAWLRLGSSAMLAAVYLATWLVIRWWLRIQVPGNGPTPKTSPSRAVEAQIVAISSETLAIAAVSLWVLCLASIAALFTAFGGDYTYRLQSVACSLQSGTQACLVEEITPGGVLGNMYLTVYLLPPTESWAPDHRGLLVWTSRHTDVSSVEWIEDKQLRVHVGVGNDYHPRYRSFSRRGFQVSTVADSLY